MEIVDSYLHGRSKDVLERPWSEVLFVVHLAVCAKGLAIFAISVGHIFYFCAGRGGGGVSVAYYTGTVCIYYSKTWEKI